ncbi:type I-E CRISPR-associated protein Cse2/CasB [Actinomadura darangshiensis]|uniref:Type I-E CRISPR-associated protein Cse2/CasB n=1 Tax=Actinomadura darangshiensis TaxID=705336 RepID=A0A4R5AWN8_9ACTN|nr:type I-E CRISPR-associated protein Cse2/CasB [Actinomadura darangshiensis]TDD77888.1 type I-E CRISPR-associated protein Cse2/CasB [Actinomadura darangshiensis]
MAQRYWNKYVGPDGAWRDKRRPPGEDLAVMRTGLGRDAGTVPALCRYYTCEIDDWAARRGEVSIEQAAEHAALALFGLHQQSKTRPMHRPGVPLGKALRKLREDGKFSQQAVDARVDAAATATNVTALLMRLRSLIDQLRTINQPLDYDQLMKLIHDWHSTDGRQRARRKWAVDYQVWIDAPDQAENGAASSPRTARPDEPAGS